MSEDAAGDAAVTRERARLLVEHARRAREVPPGRYAPQDPAEALLREERARVAAALLRDAGALPRAGAPCLEAGCGSGGFVPTLLAWGLSPADVRAIDLDAARVAALRAAFPGVDARVGDATALPWPPGSMRLVVAATLFSSVLDPGVRARLARALEAALAPGGALLSYDLAVNNPWNPAVRGIGRRALAALFPALRVRARRVSLAPPLARLVAPRSLRAARLLGRVPWLRTHLLAVLAR